MKKFLMSFVFVFSVLSSESFCAEKPILVNQPFYNSMNFYVHKPANLHKDFYVTYDGFIVYKAEKGIWKYASYSNNAITKTNYIVGSVVPSIVNLKPYDPKISLTAPILDETKDEKITDRVVYTPPSWAYEFQESQNLSLNSADWTQNENFMLIRKWQKSIDRIGILDRPRTPAAWKGDYPEVIYIWTGREWKQILAKGKNISAFSTLRREIYPITVHINKLNLLQWTNDDSIVLSQYALMWGYRWLGQIISRSEY